jgi:tetratricopeptide (TPR) repeat protein
VGSAAAEAFFLNYLGSLEFQSFRFRAAIANYQSAIERARRDDSLRQLPSLYLNLSSVYLQLEDLALAEAAAREGVQAALKLPDFPNLGELYLQNAALLSRRGEWQAAHAALSAGIEAARSRGDLATEALGWSRLGDESLDRGDLDAAERFLGQSFRLRKLHRLPDLAQTYGRLGKLKLARRDWDAAYRFTLLARGAPSLAGRTLFPFQIENQLGKVEEARGNTAAALAAYGRALELARRWRLHVPSGDELPARANSELYRQILGSFVALGAEQALASRNQQLARDVLLAVEEERAFALNASLSRAARSLPDAYWEHLAELRAVESRLLYKRTTEDARRIDLLRWKLNQIETGNRPGGEKEPESFRSQNSLTDFLEGIGENEAWFSFYPGTGTTYMWVATKGALRLHRLERQELLAQRVRGFHEAVREERPGWIRQGTALYREFVQRGTAAAKRHWILSPDVTLADLPVSALAFEERGTVSPFVGRHSVEWRVPGWRKAAGRSSELLLAAGDPVYNEADPRYARAGAAGFGWFRPAASRPPSAVLPLNRLAGSREEVEGSGSVWRASGRPAVVLTGPDVSAARILAAVKSRPAVIHLATHVVPGSRPGEALLVLGLRPGGHLEVWTRHDIAELEVPGSIVVMSGCHTAQGEPVAGADVLSLGRAWLRAGAAAVVLTLWPVEDHGGRIWELFYAALPEEERRHGPGARAAAVALQRAQFELGSRAAAGPRHWAGIQVLGRN